MKELNGVVQSHILDQEVIFDNQQIHDRILKELSQAQKHILVATAWFTDPSLLGALEDKASAGIEVEVIFSDNSSNEKLDFTGLKNLGGKVMKIKRSGYGMMHQKFCVIDGRIAISGTYNWSLNAKNNNDESIFISTLPSIIEKYIEHFNKIKRSTDEVLASPKSLKGVLIGMFAKKSHKTESEPKESNPIAFNVGEEEKQLPEKHDYERILDQMIAAEVSNFDREMLKGEGYQRSKANNGDDQVLGSALDSVYSVFINEINVVEDKKNRLKSKIREEEVKSINVEKEKTELNLNTLEIEVASLTENLISRITTANTQVETIKNEKRDILDVQIHNLQGKIQDLVERIKELQLTFIRPKIKWFELLPYGFILLGLLAYIFMFYSSAAYILIFSETDAEQARMQGIKIPPPEVFNPDALSLSYDKGVGAFMFILLFVFVPLGFALFDRFVNWKGWWATLVSMFLIFIVDVVIAYKVAESIYNVKYLTGVVDQVWGFTHVFSDVNFYLVFILGAFGLLLLKVLYSRFMSIFENRDPDLGKQKKMLEVKQSQEEINKYKDEIKGQNEEILAKENEILNINNEIQTLTSTKEFLPVKKAMRIEKIRNESSLKIQNIERITSIYMSHIDNDILPISMDSIKDRINIYLEGWNNYLHEHYSIKNATEKGQRALEAANKWKSERMEKKLIDTRIAK